MITYLAHKHERILALALLKPVLAASHRRAFDARFAWHSKSWADAGGAPPPSDTIVVSGFVNEVLGIGQAARLTAAALSAAGLTVVTEDLRPLDRGLLTRPPVGLAPGRTWLIHANPPEARIALLRHDYAAWKDRYRIGYWVWESSIAPRAWIEVARYFHEIWTPSQSARDAFASAFEQAGRSEQVAKLRVVPHPVPAHCVRATRPDDAFQALTLFDPRSDFDRKNPQGAIDAWLRAFPTPGVGRLIVKSLGEAAHHPRLDALRDLAASRGDIDIRAETLSVAETADLIADSQVMLSLHRAEGFGLPLAEAMAQGLTVIATGWSGNMQYMNAENAMPVPFRLVAANARYNGPEAQWAEPDVDEAARLLRTAASDRDLRARLGERAKSDIAGLAGAWRQSALFPSAEAKNERR